MKAPKIRQPVTNVAVKSMTSMAVMRPCAYATCPFLEFPVYLEIRQKCYRCRDCDNTPTSTQSLDWHEHRSPNTKPYENWLLRMLVNSTVADVARKLGGSEGILTGVLAPWIAKEVDWHELPKLSVISLDEIARERGHRDFVLLLTTLTVSGVESIAVL